MADKSVRKVIDLPIDDILPNRYQPRIKFDDTAIFELSESIKNHGVFQPIIVRPIGDKYEIIAGERRYKASVLADKKTIPSIIMNLNDKDSIEIALIENVQRTDLTPIEEAISYKKILDMGYIKQEDLAHKLGKNQSTIANKLRLLNLDEDVQAALLETKISERHARSLLKLKDTNDQKMMLKRIINERLTVRKTDEEIRKYMSEKDNINESPIVIEDAFENFPVVEEVSIAEETKDDNTVMETVEDVENSEPIVPSVFGFGNDVIDAVPVTTANESTVVSSDEQIVKPLEAATKVDVDAIKTDAETLYEEKPLANMDALLKSEKPEVEETIEVKDEIEEPTGKFFNFNSFKPVEPVKAEEPTGNGFSFDNFVESTEVEKVEEQPAFDDFFSKQTISSMPEDEEVVIPSNKEFFEIKKPDIATEQVQTEPVISVSNEELIPPAFRETEAEVTASSNDHNIMSAVKIIREAVEKLETLGFNVDVDEIDLESMYQLIIKIDK